MPLNAAHEGYEYQDLLTSYFILKEILDENDSSFKIDTKEYPNDKIDDLTITNSVGIFKKQIKYSNEKTNQQLQKKFLSSETAYQLHLDALFHSWNNYPNKIKLGGFLFPGNYYCLPVYTSETRLYSMKIQVPDNMSLVGDTFYVDNICKGISTIWNYSELNLDLTFGVGDISRYYFGCLDNVMISKILTDSEISLLFGNQGSEITPKRGGNPFAILGRDNIYNLWKFDEGRGLTAHDAVGGNDGTLIGGATLPIWRKW